MSAVDFRFRNPAAVPLDRLLSMIPSLPRTALDRLVEHAIRYMDDMDGDPDIEPNGDELDGTGAEDDFIERYGNNMGGGWSGPGCPISDPGGGDVGDEPQMGAGQDYYPEKPRYAIDQSAGAINADFIRMRHHLREQLADLEASGSHEYARQVRSRLKALDKREAALTETEN